MMASKELFKEGGLTYKILDPSQKDAAAAVLARAFCTEPVCSAIAELDPKMKTNYHDWVEFVDFWMDHCSTNGLSVYALDEQNHRIAGVFIVRDLLFFPAGFEETYKTGKEADSKTLTPWMNFLWDLDTMASEHFAPLAIGGKGKFVDLWFLGVHPDYRGRKIANNLIKGILPLVKKAGFQFATIEATSFFTSQAAIFNDFTPVVSVEAKEWKWKGKPFYTIAHPPHGTWTFWVKDLSEV